MHPFLVFGALWGALIFGGVVILTRPRWAFRTDEFASVDQFAAFSAALAAAAHVQSLAGVTTNQPHGSGNGDLLGSGQGLPLAVTDPSGDRGPQSSSAPRASGSQAGRTRLLAG